VAPRGDVRPFFVQQFKQFAGQWGIVNADPGGISAGVAEAADKPAGDRIADICEDDRDGPGLVEQSRQLQTAGTDDDIRAERDQFCGSSANALAADAGIPMLERDIAAIEPTV